MKEEYEASAILVAIGSMWKLAETLSAALFASKSEQVVGGVPDESGGGSAMNRPSSLVLGNVDGERAVDKLKGYFSLAKSEIDKAVRADEWGLLDDALLHYRNADRILSEGVAAPAAVESSRCGNWSFKVQLLVDRDVNMRV